MPYAYDPNLEDDDNNNPASAQISGGSSTSENTGNEGTPSGSPQQNTQAPSHGKLNTGSGFQNLDKYLSTNQSKGFGQQVLGKVDDQVKSAGNQMTDASNQFKNQVNSANNLPNTEQLNQAIANPTQADPKLFQGWLSDSYKGPKSLSESQDVWNKYWSGANQAQTSAQQLGSEPGRFALLDQYFGKPSYNFGEKSLDNLLVQQSGLGRESRDVQNQAKVLQSQGKQQEQSLQGVAAQRAGEVDDSRNAARKAIGIDDQGQVLTGENAGALGQQYQDVENQVTQAQAARTAAQNAVRGDAASGQFSADELSKLGIGAGTNLYNLNLGDYLSNNGAAVTKDQVMSPEQRARIQALSGLAGISDSFASGNAQDLGSDYGFDINRFNQDQAAAKSAYDTAGANFREGAANALPWDWYSQLGSGPLSQDPNAAYNQLKQLSDILYEGVPGDAHINDLLNAYRQNQSTYQPGRFAGVK